MLQKSLNGVIDRVCLAVTTAELEEVCDRLPPSRLKGLTQSPDLVTLHLRRQLWPLEYVTPLALQLSNQIKVPTTACLELLVEELLQLPTLSPLEIDLDSNDRQPTILYEVAPVVYQSGQLGLQLSALAVANWIYILSEAAWPERQTVSLPPNLTIKPDSLSRSLKLSPMAFMQYVHARSTTLLNLTGCLDQPAQGTNPMADLDAETTAIEFTLAARPVLWALVHLIDQLNEVDNPSAAAQLAYKLSEVAYEWFQEIRLSSLTETRPMLLAPHILLKAIQQSLKHVLEVYLDQTALEHF